MRYAPPTDHLSRHALGIAGTKLGQVSLGRQSGTKDIILDGGALLTLYA